MRKDPQSVAIRRKIFEDGETYFVTLNTLSNRTQRRTETPSGGITCVFVRIISVIEPITTKQSKRLNSETK